MTRIEGFKVTKRAQLVARMNQRYHSDLRGRFAVADKSIRVAVGVLAVASAAMAASSSWSQSSVALVLAFVSAAAAVILNVLPVGEWEKNHLDLFRRWSNLRRRWESLEMQIVQKDVGRDVSASEAATFDELNVEKLAVENDEPRRFHKFWSMREAAVRKSFFGDADPQEFIEQEIDRRFGAQDPQREPQAELAVTAS